MPDLDYDHNDPITRDQQKLIHVLTREVGFLNDDERHSWCEKRCGEPSTKRMTVRQAGRCIDGLQGHLDMLEIVRQRTPLPNRGLFDWLPADDDELLTSSF